MENKGRVLDCRKRDDLERFFIAHYTRAPSSSTPTSWKPRSRTKSKKDHAPYVPKSMFDPLNLKTLWKRPTKAANFILHAHKWCHCITDITKYSDRTQKASLAGTDSKIRPCKHNSATPSQNTAFCNSDNPQHIWCCYNNSFVPTSIACPNSPSMRLSLASCSMSPPRFRRALTTKPPYCVRLRELTHGIWPTRLYGNRWHETVAQTWLWCNI